MRWLLALSAFVLALLPIAARANPAYVQFWSGVTAVASSDTGLTVTANASGSAAHNPTAGNLLLCFVVADNGSPSNYSTTPTGWTFIGENTTSGWSTIQLFQKTAVGGGSDACTSSFGVSVTELVMITEVSGGTVDIFTNGGAQSVTTPWNTPTGTGVASQTNELQFLVGVIDDGILTTGTPSGFTNLAPSAQGNHGPGGGNPPFGGSWQVAVANTLTGSTSIASQNFSWGLGSGTETVLGMSVLVQPVQVAANCVVPGWIGAYEYGPDFKEPPWIGAIQVAR